MLGGGSLQDKFGVVAWVWVVREKFHSSRSILILSSHLRLGLSNGLFPVGLPVNIMKALLPSSVLATCPAHLILLDLITLTILGERYKL